MKEWLFKGFHLEQCGDDERVVALIRTRDKGVHAAPVNVLRPLFLDFYRYINSPVFIEA